MNKMQKGFILTAVLTLAVFVQHSMVEAGATFSRITTWSDGQVLTAGTLNGEFDNVLNNFDPSGVDDQSTDVTAMQSTADPYPGGSPSLATDLAGEIQRLRYQTTAITGEAQWYIDPDTTLSALAPLANYDYAPLRDEYRNLTMTDSAAETVTATADYIMLWNGSNYPKRLTSFNRAAALSNAGAAGLDTGTKAANTWYHVWAIASDTANRLLLSTNSTSPTMPSGYTFKGYIGAVYNGASAGGIRDFTQKNDTVFYEEEVVLVTNTTGAWTSASNAAYFPTTATVINLSFAGACNAHGFSPSSTGFGGCYVRADEPGTTEDYGIFNVARTRYSSCVIPYTANRYYYASAGCTNGRTIFNGWRY